MKFTNTNLVSETKFITLSYFILFFKHCPAYNFDKMHEVSEAESASVFIYEKQLMWWIPYKVLFSVIWHNLSTNSLRLASDSRRIPSVDLFYINNCPTRCNTKQSVYYSASSLYMFRLPTTPIIMSIQNCNYSLRYWSYFLCIYLPPA